MSSEQSTPEWQRVNPHANSPIGGDEQIAVMPNGKVYINRFADWKHFNGYDYVYAHIDPELGLLGFEPTNESDHESVSITREHEFGGSVSAKAALQRLGIDISELEETLRAEPLRFDPIVAIDVSPLHVKQHEQQQVAESADTTADQPADKTNQDVEAEPSDPEQRRREIDAISEIEDETRQAIAGRIDTALATTDGIEQTSSELCETLDLDDLSARVLGQHLRFLRDDDRGYPFTINYRKADHTGDSYWELHRPSDLQSVGSTADDSDPDAEPDEQTDQERIDQLIDSGVNDVHQLAVEADLQTTEVRAIARDLDRYSELNDAAEGGGYGRGGSK